MKKITTPVQVTAACLLEINRPDLLRFIFTRLDIVRDQNKIPHWEDNSNNFSTYALFVDTDLKLSPPSLEQLFPLPVLDLSDVALIEKAMAIGFKAFDQKYSCIGCDDAFKRAGVNISDLSHS